MAHGKLTEGGRRQIRGRLAYGVPEVADAVGVSSALIRDEIARGRLRAGRIGTRVVVLAEDLDAYLRQSTSGVAR